MIKFLLLLFSLKLYSEDQLSVITYNMDLKPGEENSRLPEIIKNLKTLNGDLLCLQEVFEPEKVIKELNYLHSYYKEYSQSFFPKGVCPIWEIFKLSNPFFCRLKNCSDFVGKALNSCLIENCRNSMEDLKQRNNDCAQAFITQLSKHPIVDIFDLINPFNSIPKFLDNGSNGLLLLSKYELKNKELADFSLISSIRNRGALIADVSGFRVICATTTGRGGGYVYMGSYASWEEENKIHIEKLKKWLTGKDDILLGNLNCSKSVPYTDIGENFSKNCEDLEELALEEPIYMKPECTYCPYNNLVHDQESGGLILDNLFINKNSLIDVDVVMKNLTDSDSFMSDHFGVRVILKKNPREEE